MTTEGEGVYSVMWGVVVWGREGRGQQSDIEPTYIVHVHMYMKTFYMVHTKKMEQKCCTVHGQRRTRTGTKVS